MDYTDEEKNEFPYNLALQYDKRTYCQYYISLIKTKHNFINTFLYNKDYNTKIIKIDSFFVNFALGGMIHPLSKTNVAQRAFYYNQKSLLCQVCLSKVHFRQAGLNTMYAPQGPPAVFFSVLASSVIIMATVSGFLPPLGIPTLGLRLHIPELL